MEKRLQDVENAVRDIGSDLKYLREKLDGYFKTHDKVILLEERITVANKRIKDLENDADKKEEKFIKLITENANEIINIRIKTGSMAVIISIAISVITTIIIKSI